mgnify:FL=1
MSNILFVVNRITGERTEVSAGEQGVRVTGPSDIQLGIDASQISQQVAVGANGKDLMLVLQDGSQILLENFFSFEIEGLGSRILVDGAAGAGGTAAAGAAAGGVGAGALPILGATALSGLAVVAGSSSSSAAVSAATPAAVSYADDVGSVTAASSTAAITDDAQPGMNVGANLVGAVKLYVDGPGSKSVIS